MTIEAAIRNTSEIYRPEGARVIDISPGSEPRAEWKPVSAEVPALPREQFPLDVFPEWLRDACGGLSASVQLPADVPACLALGFIGAALNKRVVTVGGLVATIDTITEGDQEVILDLGNGVKVTALRHSIQGRPETPKAVPMKDADKKKSA